MDNCKPKHIPHAHNPKPVLSFPSVHINYLITSHRINCFFIRPSNSAITIANRRNRPRARMQPPIGFIFGTVVLTLLAILYTRHPKQPTAIVSTEDVMSSQPDAIRLVIVSDTHRSYNLPIPTGDVLIHCGDSEWSAAELENWATANNHSRVLAIAGNMDFNLDKQQASFKRVTYLRDSLVTINGVTIYGSPWTPKFTGVFQLYSAKDAREVWQKVPSQVDVLITHGPPKGIRDVTSRGKSVGDAELLTVVKDIRPRVHCFGHIHESYGVQQGEHTLFCNAAVFNSHPPIVVDVPLDRTKPAHIVTSS